MTKPVWITVDSTSDLSAALRERFQIGMIPLTITLGGESFPDDGHFTPEHLYERYRRDGALPKTSAPSVQEFIDFFRPAVERGASVVHLSISAVLSNTANAARLAAQEFPEGSVYTIDSKSLSTGLGLLAIEGAECRDRGMEAGDIASHLEALTDKVDTSFVLDTLDFMSKGGRCSNFAALGANLLKLKPALEMKDGRLGVYKKYRGSIDHVYAQYVADRLSGKMVRPGHLVLLNSGGVDPAVLDGLETLIRRTVPYVQEIHRHFAGCTVCTHCGPKTLGLLFINE